MYKLTEACEVTTIKNENQKVAYAQAKVNLRREFQNFLQTEKNCVTGELPVLLDALLLYKEALVDIIREVPRKDIYKYEWILEKVFKTIQFLRNS